MKPNDMPKWEPWETEPIFEKWLSPTGLYCAVVRHRQMGHLCGYVRVPIELKKRLIRYGRVGQKTGRFTSDLKSESGSYKKNGKRERRVMYNHRSISDLECHGGVTFCGTFKTGAYKLEKGVWVGFDCAHAGDLVPGIHAFLPALAQLMSHTGETYKNFSFVRQQCEKLAQQIKKI